MESPVLVNAPSSLPLTGPVSPLRPLAVACSAAMESLATPSDLASITGASAGPLEACTVRPGVPWAAGLPALHATMALGGPVASVATVLGEVAWSTPPRRVALDEIPEKDRPLATAISGSPLLGDPDPLSLSSVELLRTWQMVDRLGLDPAEMQSLHRLSESLGVEPPQERLAQATERVFGPVRLDASGEVLRRTRIISTIGPASANVETLSRMIESGTDVVRLNFSHVKTMEQARQLVDVARQAMEKAGRDVVLLGDLPGPKLRVADLETPIPVSAGKKMLLTREGASNSERLAISPPQILDDLKVGDRVFIDDGLIALMVRQKGPEGVQVEIVGAAPDAVIKSRKGLNLPDTRLTERIPTSGDLARMAMMKELGIDTVAASFVEDAADVNRVRAAWAALEPRTDGSELKIVAKVERPQAMDNLAEIYKASDAVMIARGDMAVEMGDSAVPLAQQRMNRLGAELFVPTGTATQMLESMTTGTRPTRAETSDVARAVLEGSAFVMTSGETAAGVDPPHVVETMNEIVVTTEKALREGRLHREG